MNRLSESDSLIFADILCKKLASDLDANDMSSISIISNLLLELPLDVLLLALRGSLTIGRCVKYNLDEHADFSKLLLYVNKVEKD